MLEDVKMVATGRAIANYALVHQLAAKHFADRVGAIEDAHAHHAFGAFWNDIRMYTTAAVVSSACAVEAFINECFLLPNGLLRTHIPNFDTAFWGTVSTKGRRKRDGIDWMPSLAKYDEALKVLGEPELEKFAATPAKHADALIRLRNSLVHFKPLYDPPSTDQQQLEQDLRACGFTLSRYPGAGSDFVLQCMSASCATWAVQTSTDLVSAFAHRTGLNINVADAFKV